MIVYRHKQKDDCDMKRSFGRIIVAVLALAAVSLLCSCGDGKDRETDAPVFEPDTRVVGYLPDWSYSYYKTLDFEKLTHINIAFCNPDGGGRISCGIPENDLTDLVTRAHGKGVRVMAALGGGGYCDVYRTLTATAGSRQTLNESVTAFCEKYDLDGIDLDIELGASDTVWNAYGAWVEELRAICDDRNWLLSTATAQWVAERVSEKTFAMFDYLNVMAYDNESDPSSHASYDFSVRCLNYFHDVKKVDKKKLVLGVPFYGRGYKNGELDWNSYRSFADIVKEDGALYDADVTPSGVAYNGASTVKRKCELADGHGGMMIWEITLDAGGEYSLLDLIAAELLSDGAKV